MLPAIIRKMHLARCLETQNWEGIRHDLDKRPIEGISGKSAEIEILHILKKYGISQDPKEDQENPVTRHSSFVTLSLWGTGQVFREFLHVDDMASASVKVLEELDVATLDTRHATPATADASSVTFLNIGTGIDQTIADLATLVKSVTGFTGEIHWDNSKPDGTYKKLLDVSILKGLGWTPEYSLRGGIESVYQHYVA